MMQRLRFVWALRHFFVGLVAFLIAASAAHAEYPLSSGDEVEIMVFRVPELNRRAMVDVEGKIAFPPLGLIDAKGLDVEALSQRIRDMLISKQILSDAQVTVALAAARPVFVGGDVVTPGAYGYRADLSVRQAIALAGGVGLSRIRGLEEIATLRGERDVLATDMLREQVRSARLSAEMAESDALTLAPGVGAGVPAAQRDAVIDLETRRLVANRAEVREEKAHLERASQLIQERIATLSQQQEIQRDQTEKQALEVARIRDIQDRGLASSARVLEEQRVYDSMQERVADNAAEISRVREQMEESSYGLARFDARRRAALESEAQESLLTLEGVAAKLRSANERLAQLGFSDGQLEITLYRTENGSEVAVPAVESTPLRPGDTVEIKIESLGAESGGAAPVAEPALPAVPPAPVPLAQ